MNKNWPKILLSLLLPFTVVLLGEQTADYIIPLILAEFAVILFLSILPSRLALSLPSWLILIFWVVGYFFQFALFVYYSSNRLVWPERVLQLRALADWQIHDALTLSLWCFFASLLAATVVFRVLVPKDSKRALQLLPISRVPGSTQTSVILFFTVILSIVCAFFQHEFGVAVAGVEPSALPYKIAGLSYYTRVSILPYVTLLVLLISVANGNQRQIRLCFIYFVFNGLMSAALSSSRGSFLFSLLPPFCFLLVVERTPKYLSRYAMVVAFLTLIGWPFLSEYRNEIAYQGRPSIEALSESFQSAAAKLKSDPGTYITDATVSLTTRITGFSSLLLAIRWGPSTFPDHSLSPFLERGVVTEWFTEEIAEFGASAGLHRSAPGLVGFWYLLWGNTFAPIGVAISTGFCMLIYYGLSRSRLTTRGCAMASIPTLMFQVFSEGTLDSLTISLILLFANVVIGEFLGRSVWRLVSEAIEGT